MNRSKIFNTIGRIILLEGILFLLPLIVSLIYGESVSFRAFLVSIALCAVIGSVMVLIFRPKNHITYAREGFATVTLAWLAMSAIGALPFYLSREIPSYVDAFFETVSGFTTTGASILKNVEALSHGMLFWRSFTHWVGGMGVLVFIMAIIPNVSDRSINLMKAEMPGPIIGKLVPKVKDTAKILYLMYIVITAVEVIFLMFGGMSVFESLVHAFGTAGTGGFGIKLDSIASYSPYIQWVLAIFMLLFGVNFNLYYLLLIKRFRSVLRSTELWVYIGIVVASVAMITLNIMPIYQNFTEAIRYSSFQVSSVITTTGYSTVDFNLWPDFSKAILFILMFLGGCAGSTAGGLKLSRAIILFKMVRKELRRMLHPRSVQSIKFEDRLVDEQTQKSISVYFALYIACIVFVYVVLAFESFDFETNFTAAVSCFNNVGPAYGKAMAGYFFYSPFSKIVLSMAMLFGRLEMFPIILALSPSTWTKK